MALFSFARTAGKQLASIYTAATGKPQPEPPAAAAADVTKDPAWLAAQLQAVLVGLNLGVEHLEVTVNGDTATLSGTAPTQKARELAVLVVGNVAGIAAVDDRIEVVAPEPPGVFHTVEKGDTLSKIAQRHYGVLRMYDVIFEANTPMLTSPDAIEPGQVLRIPPVSPPRHVVAKGDTLGSIAKHWYGDVKRYKDIFEANRDQLADPDRIEVGQALAIPLIAKA